MKSNDKAIPLWWYRNKMLSTEIFIFDKLCTFFLSSIPPICVRVWHISGLVMRPTSTIIQLIVHYTNEWSRVCCHGRTKCVISTLLMWREWTKLNGEQWGGQRAKSNTEDSHTQRTYKIVIYLFVYYVMVYLFCFLLRMKLCASRCRSEKSESCQDVPASILWHWYNTIVVQQFTMIRILSRAACSR